MIAIHDRLSRWLIDHALPLWDQHGVDRRSGGYFEAIGRPGPRAEFAATGEVRRGRVVARQIYVFDVGRQLGWRSAAGNPVAHGAEYLFSRLHRGDGVFHTAFDTVSREPHAPFSLYEQAFYLFALAKLNATLADRLPLAATALRTLERLRRSVGNRSGGFHESNPPSLPLKSNPHMHLLEAALAWVQMADGALQAPWSALASELVGLCLTHFRDPSTGAIREYFGYDWQAAAGDDGRIVEPGHQFEWAWLLLQWSDSPHCSEAQRAACGRAAAQLIELGERGGVDTVREIAINELWDDMTVKDAAAKLWPQAERLKAWCAVLDRTRTAAAANRACGRIAAAAHGMLKYLRTDSPGLWHEVCAADGSFAPGPSRASSLYHIVGAIEALRRSVRNRPGAAP